MKMVLTHPVCARVRTFTLFKKLLGSVVGILATFILLSCGPPREDISMYVMLSDTTFITLMADQYNKSQRKIKVRVRPIIRSQLKYVVENTIKRENLFFIVTTHRIPIRGGGEYFIPLVPKYTSDLRIDALNTLGKKVMELTKNYGVPLYGFDVDNKNGISVATLSVPIQGYNENGSEALRNFFQFVSNASFHVKTLMFNHLPMYSDAVLDLLSNNQQKRAGQYLPKSKMNTDTMQPKDGRFEIAP